MNQDREWTRTAREGAQVCRWRPLSVNGPLVREVLLWKRVFKRVQMQEKTFSGLLKTDIVHGHYFSHAFDLT